MNLRAHIALAGAITLALLPTSAGADKGLGELYNTEYRRLGVIDTYNVPSGVVSVIVQEIETINCKGCDTTWFGPGLIFHMRNNTKKPVCAAFVFTPDGSDYRRHKWGSGVPYYIKGGKTLSKIGGLFFISSGDLGTVKLGHSTKTYVWEPNPDKTCPKVNFG